jgi:hypothetical protein
MQEKLSGYRVQEGRGDDATSKSMHTKASRTSEECHVKGRKVIFQNPTVSPRLLFGALHGRWLAGTVAGM